MREDASPFLYLFMDREHFETLQRYVPDPAWTDLVKSLLTGAWRFATMPPWVSCIPQGADLPEQGWKIHVSITPSDMRTALERLVPILAAERTAFKYAADPSMLEFLTGKNWPRAGSGKCLTIYPRDEEAFVRIIERCYRATKRLAGPYVLSDRPYKDSLVVFYRYGGFQGMRIRENDGRSVPAIRSKDGSLVPDQRVAWFQLPPGVTDPFPQGPEKDEGGLLNGRYQVLGAMRFSTKGGVYRALDTVRKQTVVIKEARPCVNASEYGDATDSLKRDMVILKRLAATGSVPAFVQMFREWEHTFLVEEFLELENLFAYSLSKTGPYVVDGRLSAREYLDSLISLAERLARFLRAAHDNGIIIRDLTRSNVLVSDDALKIIDFEHAYQEGDDYFVPGGTRGYMSPQQAARARPTPADDHYALGALLFDFVFLNVNYGALNPHGLRRLLGRATEVLRLPPAVGDVIAGLMHQDASERWTPDRAVDALHAARAHVGTDRLTRRTEPSPEPRREAMRTDIERLLPEVSSYLQHKADFSRSDRLWPAAPEVYETNPVSILHGAAGTAYYLLRATGEVPAPVVSWLLSRMEDQPCPPGLFIGRSGVAWVLLEAGYRDQAVATIDRIEPESACALPDIVNGAAGWGLANLRFWLATGEERFLSRARLAGAHLAETAKFNRLGASWPNGDDVYFGFDRGASGIAAFLCYLHLADGDSAWLELAGRALDFDLANGEWCGARGEQLMWRASEKASATRLFPHWRSGSAGVGAALLRYHRVTGEPRYRRAAERCYNACSSPFSNKVWYAQGMAGFGELALDMHQVTGDARYLDTAYDLAESILAFRIETPHGVAFPGYDNLRVGCDFAMGIAGTALYLHRVVNPAVQRPFMIDELFEIPRESNRRADVHEAAGV